MRGICPCLIGEGDGWTPDPPYLDTTCKVCKQVIEHTGVNGGINWIVKDSRGTIDPERNKVAPNGIWECWCPHQRALGHRHVPLDLVSEAEIEAVKESLQQSTHV